MVLGLISDTHGLLREEALEALRGSEMILHAGDVGEASILERLAEIAPVRAVRGNVDGGELGARLPMTEVIEVEGRSIFMLHIVDSLDLSPKAAGFDVVVFGHSHRPHNELRDGVLYFNPGSAGPRRFDLPITVGRMEITTEKIDAGIITIVE